MEYDQIKYYFNEYPRKAMVKPVGVNQFEYHEIFPWLNSSERAASGLQREPNHDYWQTCIYCDNQWMQVVTFYDHVHPESLGRYGLNEPINYEDQPVGTQLNIEVITGSYLPCNKYRTQWQYIAQHATRLVMRKTEWLGSIIALSNGVGEGYMRPVPGGKRSNICRKPLNQGPFRKCGDSTCERCGDVTGDAVEASLIPCPTAKFIWDGETQTGNIRIRLSDVPQTNGALDFEFVDQSAVFGTNYSSDFDNDGTPERSGSIAIEAGCADDILIPITLLDVPDSGDPDNPTQLLASLCLSNPTGGVSLGGCTETTFCIEDGSFECPPADPCDGGCSHGASPEDCPTGDPVAVGPAIPDAGDTNGDGSTTSVPTGDATVDELPSGDENPVT